jgi:hypothetical protein
MSDILHSAADVFDDTGPTPDGCWISPCGEWQFIVMRERGVHQVGSNRCSCAFCQELRARWPFEKFMRTRARLRAQCLTTLEPKIELALARGWEAHAAGKFRKQVPAEYRTHAGAAEVEAWRLGWDRHAKHYPRYEGEAQQ